MMLNAPEACKFIPRCLSYYIILPLLPYEFLNCSSCKYLDLEIITGTYWNHLYRHWNTKDPSPEGSPEVPPGVASVFHVGRDLRQRSATSAIKANEHIIKHGCYSIGRASMLQF